MKALPDVAIFGRPRRLSSLDAASMSMPHTSRWMPCRSFFSCCRIAMTGAALFALLGGAVGPAAAQEFSVLVTPPRIEARARPGEVHREIIEITNMGAMPAAYQIRTADWTLDAQAQAQFFEDLAPGSCRPWVAIEAKQIHLPAGGKYRYRIEVSVPPDSPAIECRFGLLIEGAPQALAGAGLPQVSGRIGVIVYVAVGEAEAHFEILGAERMRVEGVERPALRLRNAGLAHGRLEGFVDAVDGKGRKILLTPSNLPILAGETRVVPLSPVPEPNGSIPELVFPVVLQGKLEQGSERLDVQDREIR